MSAPANLSDCYTEELADLWSANDQMTKVVRDLADAAQDRSLTDRLSRAADGIEKHTKTLKSLLKECGESEKEHCKGMEGLVKEARKHALEADIEDADVRDVLIVAQYQRMCHYGIAGFGTAKAFAEALGNKDHATKLDTITSEIYDADENMTDLAERSINLEAKKG
ncbi:ferritin-like domain-containing protein [Erythrobacter sp. SD-21]|uniref:ferritin-like domain-containing protein n=1 Tax=Erythrobacter sp. SD-21 TaxID=161528 RepID=UPI00054FE461|nr:ferritin-like domain-containing protein [Erythrobacter sp. SD-21]